MKDKTQAPVISQMLKDLPTVNMKEVANLQGNLKSLTSREYDKLYASIMEHGVVFPIFVWKEQMKLLDGHQRARMTKQEKWDIKWPVVYVSAPDLETAKKLLLVATSQYGKITQEGWDEFTFDLDEDWLTSTTHFDALPFVFGDFAPQTEFLSDFLADDKKDGKNEDGEDESEDLYDNPYVGLNFTASEEQRNYVMSVLRKVKEQTGAETAMDALLDLCKFYEDSKWA